MTDRKKRTYRSYPKTIKVTIEMEVDRNAFIASRLLGTDYDSSFRGVENMDTEELNDLVYTSAWVEVRDKITDLHESITINEEVTW